MVTQQLPARPRECCAAVRAVVASDFI